MNARPSSSKKKASAKPAKAKKGKDVHLPAVRGERSLTKKDSSLPNKKEISSVEKTMHLRVAPLPDAAEMRAYNEVVPNTGERLLRNFEKNQANSRLTKILGLMLPSLVVISLGAGIIVYAAKGIPMSWGLSVPLITAALAGVLKVIQDSFKK